MSTLRFVGSMFLGLAVSAQTAAARQKNPCDPSLRLVTEIPQGYKLRGDRCEGIYIQPVSGASSLLVASFTSFFEDFSPAKVDKLSLAWSSPAEAPVHLRAFGLREKLYYQMDTVADSKRTSYIWPGDVLNSLRIAKQDIGVVGYTDYSIGGEERTLLLPLGVDAKGQKPGNRYQLILVPGSELKEVFLSMAKVGADGQAHDFSISDRPLRRGYYPAERGYSSMFPLQERLVFTISKSVQPPAMVARSRVKSGSIMVPGERSSGTDCDLFPGQH
ncbi:MAG: hypothetical protein M3N41_09145 [Acidobacteriota bacterium]|nr:hypothetical protein [Acidobacteriota bacterium]